MTLVTYIPQILAIAKHHKVDVGVAKDMFLTNIRNMVRGIDIFYDGAGDKTFFESLVPFLEELENTTMEFHDEVQKVISHKKD